MPLLNLLLLSTFGDHLAAVAAAATSCPICPLCRKPPMPPKRPHCHLTRFLSWCVMCVRCAQPRKFVGGCGLMQKHKQKPFFWTNNLEEKPTTTTKKTKQKMSSPRLVTLNAKSPKKPMTLWKKRIKKNKSKSDYNTCVLVLLPSQFCVQISSLIILKNMNSKETFFCVEEEKKIQVFSNET